MKMYTLVREQRISRPLHEVFFFFAKPENLSRITPPWLELRILTPSPIGMRAGALIDCTVRVLGLRRHWRTLITEYEPPHRFIDVQLKGPYVLWHHTHSFHESEGTTVMRDEVRYVLPGGIFGKLFHPLVRRQLQRIFDYRQRAIESVFTDGRPATPAGKV